MVTVGAVAAHAAPNGRAQEEIASETAATITAGAFAARPRMALARKNALLDGASDIDAAAVRGTLKGGLGSCCEGGG